MFFLLQLLDSRRLVVFLLHATIRHAKQESLYYIKPFTDDIFSMYKLAISYEYKKINKVCCVAVLHAAKLLVRWDYNESKM